MHHHIVEYSSDYLVPGVSLPGVLAFHQISLTWDQRHPGAGGGTLAIDPNGCGLDTFGERTICTKMAVAARDLRLQLLAEKPGHRAYTIETRERGSTDPFAALPLRLVAIDAQGGEPARVRLLVLAADQTIARIIDLHADRVSRQSRSAG